MHPYAVQARKIRVAPIAEDFELDHRKLDAQRPAPVHTSVKKKRIQLRRRFRVVGTTTRKTENSNTQHFEIVKIVIPFL